MFVSVHKQLLVHYFSRSSAEIVCVAAVNLLTIIIGTIMYS